MRRSGVDGAILQIEKLLADLDAFGTGGQLPPGDRRPRRTLVPALLGGEIARDRDGDRGGRSGAACERRRAVLPSSELERLSRDVRAGMYHPSDLESVHASYAKALLGEIGGSAQSL